MVVQNQILNKILATKNFSIVTLNNLSEKYFFNYTDEFNFIKNHYETYKIIPDTVTFLKSFPNFDIVDVSEPDAYLIQQLFEDYNQAYLAKRFNTIKKMLEGNEVDKAVNFFLHSVDGLERGAAIACTDILKDYTRFEHYKDRLARTTEYYTSTGFPELDQLIGGIDRQNENMIIAARPGQGKTQVMTMMAAAASKAGLTVGIFEGEMTTDKLAYRFDTVLGNVKNSDINRGKGDVYQQYSDYIKALPSCNYGPIKIMTLNDCGGVCTVDTLRAFIEKEHLDILFVDQYSLMDDTSKAKVLHERIGSIAKSIKKLQVEKKIPIISVSQMNRTKTDTGEQDTSQVAGSDMISQYATVLIMLEQKEASEDWPAKVTLNIVKARDGGDHHKVTYGVDFNNGFWSYIPVAKDGISSDKAIQQLQDDYMVDASSYDQNGDSLPF